MKKPRFDSVVHGRPRLQICAFLAPIEEAEFQVLRDELDISDSVLSKHIKQLEEAGYVKQRKSAVNGRQRTWAYLTEKGRRSFEGHVQELQRLVNSATVARDTGTTTSTG